MLAAQEFVECVVDAVEYIASEVAKLDEANAAHLAVDSRQALAAIQAAYTNLCNVIVKVAPQEMRLSKETQDLLAKVLSLLPVRLRCDVGVLRRCPCVPLVAGGGAAAQSQEQLRRAHDGVAA